MPTLQEARPARGWPPEELAGCSGVEADVIAGLESGQRQQVTRDVARAVAAALGLDAGTVYELRPSLGLSALVEEDEDYLGFRMRTLVTDRYRLTAYSGQPYGELFDLRQDPHGYVNRWDDPTCARRKDELRLALLDKLMETDAPLPRQTSRS